MKAQRNITLPKVIRRKKIVGDSEIIHIDCQQGIELPIDSRTLCTSPLVLSNGEQDVCFMKIGDMVSDDYQYVVDCKYKPTLQKLINGTLPLIGWRKHPSFIESSPDKVLKSWDGSLIFKKENPDKREPGFREPQIAALHCFLGNAISPKETSVIVMPTGTGKTETMLAALVALPCEKLLCIVPSDALRNQIAEKYATLGVLPKFNLVSPKTQLPYVGIVRNNHLDREQWKQIILESNVIVTTMTILSQLDASCKEVIYNNITQVFVDEAHHTEARTWSDFLSGFNARCITLFTATPFRNDGKKLSGKYIYSFSLKEAQEQGYYKPIDFLPIIEWDSKKADKAIATKAVSRLKMDIDSGLPHILMARCDSKSRAREIFDIYAEKWPEYNPVMIYSGIRNYTKTLESIKGKNHKIIVCVNMLGEGFDMPELKIAALHDARQSLPVTLQFIGRFTRTSHDKDLGNASFIANLADHPTAEAIEDLYAKDADWNVLLPKKNDGATRSEIDFAEFLKNFSNLDECKIPFETIQFPLSCTLYASDTNTWQPSKWQEAINAQNFEYVYSSVAQDGNTLVVILGKVVNISWGNTSAIQNLEWHIVVVHRHITPKYNHLHIYSSTGEVDKNRLAEKILGVEPTLCAGEKLFRVFEGLRRITIPNFGGRKGRAGNITYKAYYGKDVEEGLSLTEQRELIKNNIFGHGFRDGNRDSIGCSIKGKIWSFKRGNLFDFQKWCRMVGALVEDESINPDKLFKYTLKIGSIKEWPDATPLALDWDEDIVANTNVQGISLRADGTSVGIWDVGLIIDSSTKTRIDFSVVLTEEISGVFSLEYSLHGDGFLNYKVKQLNGPIITIYNIGSPVSLVDYFNANNNAPVIYFSNGGIMMGNVYTIQNCDAPLYDTNRLRTIDWSGIDLSKESQGVNRRTDSIQYNFAQTLMESFDFLIDDDGSGEIADLIGIKVEKESVTIHLFHLKYAHKGKVGASIGNLYEVCGQALKSLKWKELNRIPSFIKRIAQRENLRIEKYGNEASRFLKGEMEGVLDLQKILLYQLPLDFRISIVQPGLSKTQASEPIRLLLGAVSGYIKDVSNVDLEIICSE